jgi:hypothetical protein
MPLVPILQSCPDLPPRSETKCVHVTVAMCAAWNFCVRGDYTGATPKVRSRESRVDSRETLPAGSRRYEIQRRTIIVNCDPLPRLFSVCIANKGVSVFCSMFFSVFAPIRHSEARTPKNLLFPFAFSLSARSRCSNPSTADSWPRSTQSSLREPIP